MMHKLTLTAGVLASLALSGAAQNLLQNPSFETVDGKTPAVPARWETHQVLSLGKHHALDTRVAMDGENSVRLANDNPALDAKSYILWMQSGLGEALNQDHAPGTAMELSVYAKIEAPETRFRIYLETVNAEKAGDCFITPLQEIPVGEWTQVKVKFTMPESKFTNAYVCLQLVGTGTVWFDNAYLGKANAAPQEVVPAMPKAGNRIVNSSIETLGQDGKSALAWVPYQAQIKGNFQSVAQTVAHSGIHSLKISCADPALNETNYVMFQQAN